LESSQASCFRAAVLWPGAEGGGVADTMRRPQRGLCF